MSQICTAFFQKRNRRSKYAKDWSTFEKVTKFHQIWSHCEQHRFGCKQLWEITHDQKVVGSNPALCTK